MYELKEGQVYRCPVCGVEVRILLDAEPVAPLTCCAVEMELIAVPADG
jgi:hypothetical protein